MEEDAKEPSGVTRSQNVVYVVPHDWASISFFLAPLVERVDEALPELQLLVLTADPETAAAVAGAAVRMATTRSVGIIAATSAARTSRLLKLLPSQIVVGTPGTILELVKSSALKLGTVRAVAFAWADALLAEPGTEDILGTLLGDIPKDSARTIATTEVTPAVESLIERYARRARRVTSSATVDTTPISLEYFTTSESSRTVALRRLLDALDLDNASVFVRGDESTQVVGQLLRSLGYSGANAPVRVSHGGGAPSTVLLYDLPASREELTEAMGASAKRVIGLIQPRQMSSLRALGGGGRLRPITLPDSGFRTRSRDEMIRAELRAVLERGTVGRTLLALEPLLEDFDGVDIAAAALELLELERAKPRLQAAAEPAPKGGMVRLFFSVGERDGLRIGEVVAAIGNDAGVPSTDIGKIEVRDSHTIVEVSPGKAAQVVERLTGKTMAGRRLIVRPDQDAGERPTTGTRSREGGPRREGGPKREGGARRDGPPARGGFGGERRPPRGDGPPRGRPPAGRDRPRPDR